MLLDDVTLVPPNGSSFTVSRTLPFVSGARTGALLHSVTVGPAAPSVERAAYLYARGEQVIDGPEQARDVEIVGELIAGTRAAVNTLRADLLRVVRHHGGDMIGVRYTPVATQVELSCVAVEVEATAEDGATIPFTVRLVAADAVAYRVGAADSAAMGSSGSPAAVVNTGDVEAWPTITVTGPTSGTTTGLELTNATTGDTLTLGSLTFEAGDTITVEGRPGYEAIDQDGVNLMGKRTDGTRPWSLPVGTSSVYVTATGGTGVTASISWTPGWVGY